MKKNIFLFIMLLIGINLKSQTMVDTNKIWYIDNWGVFSNDETYIYKFNGDTTFGSYQYKKLYETQKSTLTDWLYIHAMREDSNGKVYLYSNSGDVLYYDFGLNKNDTFIFKGHKMLVDSVNTISLLNNEKRKRIYLSDSSCYDQWIVGIGSLHGLTNVGYLGCDSSSMSTVTLNCCFENDTLKYHNSTFLPCYYITIGINEINNKGNLINIYPNPSSDRITIDCAEQQNFKMQIYNLVGECILQKQMKNEMNDIDISPLSKGIYIIKLSNANWAVQRKLIKV
jgi:hypothetical protein